MSVVSLDLARALEQHAAVAARAAHAEAAGDWAAVDRLAGPEGETFEALVRALPEVASPDDVAVIVEHARHEGGRDAATELVLLRGLTAVLAQRAFGPPAA